MLGLVAFEQKLQVSQLYRYTNIAILTNGSLVEEDPELSCCHAVMLPASARCCRPLPEGDRPKMPVRYHRSISLQNHGEQNSMGTICCAIQCCAMCALLPSTPS